MKKPSLIVIGFVSLLLIGGSLLAWVLFLQDQEKTVANPQDVSFLGNFPGSGSIHGGGGGIFGSTIGGSNTPSGNQMGAGVEQLRKPIVLKIYAEPVAGLVPYTTEEEAIRVRFVDKATGDILEYTYETKNTTRVVRETIPRVRNAVFTPNGKKVFRQYQDDNGALITVSTSLTNSGSGIQSTTLPAGTISVAPLTNEVVLALVRTDTGITLTQTQKERTTTLWSSALSGWDIAHAADAAVVYQYPSYDTPGILYTVQNNGVQSVMQSIRGLIALPHPDNTMILFSRSGGGVTSLFTYTYATHSEQALPIRTFASKCVWSTLQKNTIFCAIPRSMPQRDVPDAWYRGETLLQDDWYVINTQTGERTLLYNTEEASTVIDVEKPMLNASETALFFINKQDESLWMLGIPKNAVPEEKQDTPIQEETE